MFPPLSFLQYYEDSEAKTEFLVLALIEKQCANG